MYFGAKNINVSYGKELVLKNISCPIEKGKTTAIIGVNGSGKSTLLKALGRLIKFDGTVEFDEKPLSNLTNMEIARKIALLPQSVQAPTDITVYELVGLGRFPYQRLTQRSLSDKDKEFVMEIMKETNVWDFRNEKVANLSGGQRQRVFITLTLAQDSEIILLDEPTTYLDMSHQLDILTLLKNFAEKRHKTVVYVIHDLNQVARFADNLIILKNGELFDQGKTADLFTEKTLFESFGLNVSIGCDTFTQSLMITGVKNG